MLSNTSVSHKIISKATVAFEKFFRVLLSDLYDIHTVRLPSRTLIYGMISRFLWLRFEPSHTLESTALCSFLHSTRLCSTNTDRTNPCRAFFLATQRHVRNYAVLHGCRWHPTGETIHSRIPCSLMCDIYICSGREIWLRLWCSRTFLTKAKEIY